MSKALLPLLILFTGVSAHASSDTMTRVGMTFLGTGLISAHIEQHYGDSSLRFRIGIFEPQELCLAITANRYAGGGKFRPYAGVGLWSVVIAPEFKPGMLAILNVPVGVDCRVNDYNFVGAEADFNRFIACKTPGSGWENEWNNENKYLVLPAAYYSYSMQQ